MKRENGTGTITKLSGKRNNPYMAKYPTGKYDDKGNMKYVIVGYYKTKKEAVLSLAEYTHGYERVDMNTALLGTDTSHDCDWEDLVKRWEFNPLSDIIMEDVVFPIQNAIQNIPDNYDQEMYFRVGLGHSATISRVIYLINSIKSKEELLAFIINCIYRTNESKHSRNFNSESVMSLCSLVPNEIDKKFPFHFAMSSPFDNYVFTYVDFETISENGLCGSKYPLQFNCMIEKMAIDMLCTMHKLTPSFIKSCKNLLIG